MPAIVQNYATPGTFPWVCPADVTSLQVELWGGGGTGGPATGTASGGGGGAGGQYVKTAAVTVTPGTSYNIVVAAAATALTTLVNGNDSTFGATTVVAKGGAGGAVATGTTGAGGAGSATSGVGTEVRAGGSGATGVSGTQSGGGGAAGFSGNAGASGSGATGATGTAPGGNGGAGVSVANTANAGGIGAGGSGGLSSSATDRIGGAGGQGYARLTFTTTGGNHKSFLSGQTTVNPSTTVVNYNLVNVAGGASWNATEIGQRMVLPHAMLLDELRVVFTTAPGAAKSYAVALMVNGVASALTCTVSGAGVVTAQDLTNGVWVQPGDTVSIRFTPTGTPTAPGISYWSIRQSSADLYGVTSAVVGSPTAAGTLYFVPFGNAASRTTDALGSIIVPCAGVLKNFQFWARSAYGAGSSWAVTLMKNNVATSITATISGASQTTASDLVNTASVVAGDRISWRCVTTGTGSSTVLSLGVSFDPTTNYDSFLAFSGGAGLSPSASVVNYQNAIESGDSFGTTEANFYTRFQSSNVTALYVETSVSPGAGSQEYEIALRKEAADTVGSVMITNASTAVGSTRVGSATGLSIGFNDDDRGDIRVTPGFTPGALNVKYSLALNIPVVGAGIPSLVTQSKMRRNTLIRR